MDYGIFGFESSGMFKHCLKGHTSRSMEDNGDLKCWEFFLEVSGKNFSMMPCNHFCDILMKEMAAFCP